MSDPVIAPESRLGPILDRWPILEQILIDMNPAFQKLRNPVLRRTVARVATLRHVAQVGGMPVGKLVARLREAIGETGGGGDEAADSAEARPAWASAAAVVGSLDARPLIEAGEHPMERVMRELARLEAGQAFELITDFVPAPLVELARGKGLLAWSDSTGGDVVRTLFTRPAA